MKAALQLSGAILLALFGAVAGAMLTTNYSNMRTNGASYILALQGGAKALWLGLIPMLTSPWLWVPISLVALIATTVALTIRATKPKADPLKKLGHRMNKFVDAAHHDQRFREFRTLYHDTMRICREMEAFMTEVQMQGFPIPSPQSEHAEDWIDLACDYFTAVGPYLRNGNPSHAMAIAQDFANRYS